MLNIGKLNSLKINRRVDFGVYLDGHEYDEILLPGKYVPGTPGFVFGYRVALHGS